MAAPHRLLNTAASRPILDRDPVGATGDLADNSEKTIDAERIAAFQAPRTP
jgi:hypothetical protein